MNERDIFAAALDLPDPGDRAAYLDRACASDADLRRHVEGLLAAQSDLGSFLAQPALAARPTEQYEPAPDKPGTAIGPYKLVEVIDEGGMGTVYLAQQQEPVKRLVALKVIKAGMDSRQVLARFEAERQALALMDHPNIARVFDAAATPAGRPYFVMELVKGVPITKYCDEHRLPPKDRLGLFVQVCQAVQHAHQKGIIHRDLKPSNVLVAPYDGRPVVKVIDFGVAKAAGQPLTEKTLVTGLGAVVGTLEYMSPEQAELNNQDVDTRSDIYCLGILLYELLTGSTPLTRGRVKDAAFVEMLRLIREEEPPKPSTRLSDSADSLPSISAQRHMEPAKLTRLVRGELDWIVMKALEKDRARRYESANGFAADVQRYLAGEAVQAVPPSAGYRLQKFARRNRAGLGVAGLVLFFVVLLGGGAGWVLRDRAAQQVSLETEVALALEETEAFYKRDKLPEAMAALKRAEGLLATGRAGAELRQRVQQWRTDLDLVARLDEIRLEGAAVKDDHFDVEAADPAYREAFRRYGLDVEALDPDVAADRLRASAVRDRLVTALDDWAASNRAALQPGGDRLLSVAGRADSDPWRSRLRDAFGRRDGKAMAEIARDKQWASQAPETLLLLAKGLYSTGQGPLGVDVLSAAQMRFAADFWINENLGAALTKLTPPRWDAAVGFYRAAVAIRPESPGARSNLASALREQGASADAEGEYRAAIRLKPDYAFAKAALSDVLATSGDREGALAALRDAIRLKSDSARVRFSAGDALRHLRMLDQAIVEYREALRLKPDFAEARTHLGLAFSDKGLPDEAIAEYRTALQSKPDLPQARVNLATRLVAKGLLDEAVAECRETLRRHPDHALAYYILGKIAHQKSLWDEAIAQYGKAIELDPKLALAHAGLGFVLMQKGRIDEAIAANRQAIRLKPGYNFALWNLGLFLSQKGWDLVHHPDPTARDLKRAAELGNEAVERGRQAVEYAPLSVEAWQYLGWTQYRAGNWAASIETLERACKLQNGGDAGQWIVLSLAHGKLANEKELPEPERLQHKAEARRLYDQAAKQIDGWGPGDFVTQVIRAFRAEAAEMLGVKDNQK